jgi:hypothetical protein
MAGLGLGIVGLVVVVLYREPLARWLRSHTQRNHSSVAPQWTRSVPKPYRHVRVYTTVEDHASGGVRSVERVKEATRQMRDGEAQSPHPN